MQLFLESVVLFMIMQMKHADIIFGQAVIQRDYEHMQKQERTNKI